MPTRKLVLDVAGREVAVSNPDKVYFPRTGHTKLDLVRYYLAVADGALRGVAARPMALKRFVNGAEGEFFFQKRAPEKRPEWVETVEAGWNRLVGLDPEAAAAAIEELPRPVGRTSPAAEMYGGGKAGERVATAIAERLG